MLKKLKTSAAILALVGMTGGYVQLATMQMQPVPNIVSAKSKKIVERTTTGLSTTLGIKTQILSIKEINGGVEVMARAWKGNKQLGFGKDGTVDIERFRFFDPPVLVDDKSGDILREWKEKMPNGSEISKQRKLREDPQAALKQILSRVIELVGKDGENIVDGKIGRTTTIIYSTADSAIDATQATTALGATEEILIGDKAGADKSRGVLRFVLPEGTDAFNSVTLSLYLYASNGAGTYDINVHEQSGTPSTSWIEAQVTWNNYTTASAWTAAGAASDFSASVAGAFNRAGAQAAGYKDFVLYGAGATNNITVAWEDTLNFLVKAPSGAGNNDYFRPKDIAGTTSDPMLVIEHSPAPPPATGAPQQIIIISMILDYRRYA